MKGYVAFTPRLARRRVVAAIALVLSTTGVLVGGVGALIASRDKPSMTTPEVVVVQTGGTTLEADLVIPDRFSSTLASVAGGNGRLVWVKTNGDGSASIVDMDLTPRTDKGDVVGPHLKREESIKTRIALLQEEMNGFDATASGRSMLGGLQRVPSGTSDVWVITLGLDTVDPLDARSLAFDVSVRDVVTALRSSDELPRNLDGRRVWFVWTQAAGAQRAPRQPQRLYREQLATAIVTAAGGSVGGFIDAGAGSSGAKGDAPVVDIPPASETLKVTVTTSPAATVTGLPATNRTCVLPTQILFYPDSDQLTDPESATSAVKSCLGDRVPEGTTAAVTGHTACTGRPADNPTAQALSVARADRIASLLMSLGVPRAAITSTGVGASRPLREPCTDQANRAVELVATIPS
jgi:outer membrane protein OmpA-like peptidoglycan-associated protein